MRNKWLELENGYLTNQPLIWVGHGKARARVPDPASPPTQAYMFCYECERTKTKIRRKRTMRFFRARSQQALEDKIVALVNRPSVILIESQDNPRDYMEKGHEPTCIRSDD